MGIEDKMLASKARHAIARTPLDISELMITCSRGIVELNGKVKRPRQDAGTTNVRKELRVLTEIVRNTPGVKGVTADRVQIMD